MRALLALGLAVSAPAAAPAAAAAAAPAPAAAAAPPLPAPISFWTFQEPTGAPRRGDSFGATAPATLLDGNASAPIPRVAGGGGGASAPFGAWAARFAEPADGSGGNNSQRLCAARAAAPALTTALGGPAATVTAVAWLRAPAAGWRAESLVAGVWNEHAAARQYALFMDLGACASAPAYAHGAAGHASNCGGPTPGQRYCETRACDPRPLPAGAWHCLAMAYNGTHIIASVNGTALPNGDAQPFFYPGGLFSPEAAGREGAEFAVGANVINVSVGSPPVWSNTFRGDIGGLAVYAEGLPVDDIARVCALAHGFGASGGSGASDMQRLPNSSLRANI